LEIFRLLNPGQRLIGSPNVEPPFITEVDSCCNALCF